MVLKATGKTEFRVVTAKRPHYCDLCERRIPAGSRYWRSDEPEVGSRKEHTNCAQFENEPKEFP